MDRPNFEYSLTGQLCCEPRKILRLTLLITIYGGIHLTAWNHPLPSTAYQTLWRWSISWNTLSGVLYSLAGCVDATLWRILNHRIARKKLSKGDGPENRHTTKRRWYPEMKFPPNTIILRSLLPGYIVASVSLVVLYIVDFVHLPPASFIDIVWSRFIPHFA